MDLQYTAALILNNMYNMQWNDYKSSSIRPRFKTEARSFVPFSLLWWLLSRVLLCFSSGVSFTIFLLKCIHDPYANDARDIDPCARERIHTYAYTGRQQCIRFLVKNVGPISRFHERLASVVRVGLE